MRVDIMDGDALTVLGDLPNGLANCCVTSPPYWGLRDYGVAGQMGLEGTPDEYVAGMVAVFREVRRVLADDGTLWLNVGDSYAANRTYQVVSTKGGPKHGAGQSAGGKGSRVPDGLKPKDLVGIPWMLAFALRADGWYLRRPIIWHKPNPMPESTRDRPTCAHEYVFLMAKSERYYYDWKAIATQKKVDSHKEERWDRATEDDKNLPTAERNGIRPRKTDKQRGHTRRHAGFNDRGDAMSREEQTQGLANARDVWTIPPAQFKGSHFATMPVELAERCIKAGSRPGDLILDPFGGAATTGVAAESLGRNAILIELNPKYAEMGRARVAASIEERTAA